MRLFLLIVVLFSTLTVGCSSNGNIASKMKGSYIQGGHTLGQVSEFQNRIKIEEDEVIGKINYGFIHGAYNWQNLTAKGVSRGALHNREWQWVGLGIHTDKGTDFTFYKDMLDKKNKFWKFTIIHTNKIRRNLSTMYGLYHYDTEHGGIKKSGGRRTSGLYGGLELHLVKGFSIVGDVTVGNNGSNFVQDVAKVHLRWTY